MDQGQVLGLGRFLGFLPAWPILRALKQSAREVTVRDPGSRLLSAPRPIAPYAAEHWEFAWLADAAYDDTPDGAQAKAAAPSAPDQEDPESVLIRAGWTKWSAFPSDALRQKIEAAHLRVQVWQKSTPPIIAVAFGGTILGNKKDWRANLRWFLPKSPDEYSAVVQTFAPQFVAAFARLLSSGRTVPQTMLVSTGHSLGGGLAQQFAYCLRPTETVPRVHKVFAFDPSPVTGFFSVKKAIRDANSKSLYIDRIYERGEVLAIVRSVLSVLWKPSATSPTIRGVRYSLFRTCNPIAGHSMVRMAGKLDAARS
jgi:Lipase (class 3)